MSIGAIYQPRWKQYDKELSVNGVTHSLSYFKNRFGDEDTIYDEIVSETGLDKQVVIDACKESINFMKDKILNDPETVQVLLPKLGTIKCNYELTAAQYKKFKNQGILRKQRTDLLNRRRTYMKSMLYKDEMYREVKIFNRPMPFVHHWRVHKKDIGPILENIYKYWISTEEYSNDRHKKFFK